MANGTFDSSKRGAEPRETQCQNRTLNGVDTPSDEVPIDYDG
jgi:hypothetical protein